MRPLSQCQLESISDARNGQDEGLEISFERFVHLSLERPTLISLKSALLIESCYEANVGILVFQRLTFSPAPEF